MRYHFWGRKRIFLVFADGMDDEAPGGYGRMRKQKSGDALIMRFEGAFLTTEDAEGSRVKGFAPRDI